MRGLLRTSDTFRADAARMTRRDGVTALGVYVGLVALEVLRFQLLLRGAFTSQRAAEASDLGLMVLSVLLVVGAVRARGQGLSSVGLRRTDLRRAVALVVPAWLALTAVGAGLMYWQGARHVVSPSAWTVVLFLPAAIEEELGFRGYLSTRAHGLLRQPALAQGLAVLLFVGIHLPGKMLEWPPSLVTNFDFFMATWLLNLALIGWVYDRLYRATGSIWPGAAAHFLVNVTLACVVA